MTDRSPRRRPLRPAPPWRARRIPGAALTLLLAACARPGGDAAPAAPPAALAAPVRIAPVSRATLRRTVTAPGRTQAQREQRIRAPFDGQLVRLAVTDGDRVEAGAVVGEIVAQDSAAALEGARALAAAARSPPERDEAERALAVTRAQVVRRALVAPAAGVVSSHRAVAGDLVSAHDELLTIAEQGSIEFLADVPQEALPLLRPGAAAEVALAGPAGALAGAVRAILPGPGGLTAPVRIRLLRPPPALASGLFGLAHLTLGERRDAVAVPAAAVLRDDLTGEARIALAVGGAARWTAVRTGLADAGLVEILSPALAPGAAVIVEGQVGLPDGAPVKAAP